MHNSVMRVFFCWSEEILVKLLLRKQIYSLENCFNINLTNTLSLHGTNMTLHSDINHIAIKFGVETDFGAYLIATCAQGEFRPRG